MNYDFIWLVSTYIGRNIKISSMRYTVEYALIDTLIANLNMQKFFFLYSKQSFDVWLLYFDLQAMPSDPNYKKPQKYEKIDRFEIFVIKHFFHYFHIY